MAKEVCTFHHNHGLNIHLLEDRTVANRVDSCNNGVVFTEQPIPSGCVFQVEVLKKSDEGYPGSLVSSLCIKSMFISFYTENWGDNSIS